MIDIHSHILPSVDDGPKTIEESRRILKMMKEQGIKKVIQTTHINDSNKDVDRKKILRLIDELKDEMEIIEGYEVNLSHITKDYDKYTINGGGYILVEFSPLTPFSIILKMCENLKNKGFSPVIAHIERFTRKIDDLKSLKDNNILLQVNAETFLNDRFYKKIVLKDLIDFIGSDFHPDRKLLMKDAKDELNRYDCLLADKIFNINPKIILKKEEE
uniref:protein-tyrosine-phosphatase n=1 Tax=candidate division WOR-3 bacterium TaxID=2052148 RepID=A0A7C4U684_UNCW3